MDNSTLRFDVTDMDAQKRILFVMESLMEKPCSVKELSMAVFQTDKSKKIRLIQNDIRLLRELYPDKIYSPKRAYYKFIDMPDFMQKVMSNNADDLSELFEFIALFDAKMLKLFEESEPTLIKKLRKEIESVYHIKDDPIEPIDNKEIWKSLKKAVKERRYISLAYKKEKLLAYNAIKPIKIVFAQNNWYLAAINTEEEHGFEFTFFRVSHIVGVTLDSKTFHKELSALKHLKDMQSLFQRYKEASYKIKVLVKPEIAPYFTSKKYLRSQQIEKRHEDGALTLSYRINNDMEIIPIVKKWLPHMIVLEPQSLKTKIDNLLRKYPLQ